MTIIERNTTENASTAPRVSLIIACRNEEAFIGDCLDSILANDYPRDLLEVLVIEGMSDDGTRAIIDSYCARFALIKVLENPALIASSAFNLGIRCATGDLIMIMGAHNVYVPDYISRCVRASVESGADNVGGIIRVSPRTPGLVGSALTFALGHPFGVGNAHFRVGKSRRWADTVFGGCYRREVFEKVGCFNEHLLFNQDIEFNLRLGRAGGRILLDPEIVSDYHARSDLKSFCHHNFRNGSWVILSSLLSEGIPFSWRHVIPLVFVSSILISAILSPFSFVAVMALLVISGSYLLANFVSSCSVAIRKRDMRYAIIMPLAFASLHISYGLGSLTALFKAMAKKLKGQDATQQGAAKGNYPEWVQAPSAEHSVGNRSR